MVKITIGLGLVLIALGVGGYVGTGRASVTALIPAFFGMPLLLPGLAALKPQRRKHAMHVAVVIGLLGFAGTARGLTNMPALLTGSEVARPGAVAVQAAMAIVCLLYMMLCVRSFVEARRAGAVPRDA
jgi:hypothetical protein